MRGLSCGCESSVRCIPESCCPDGYSQEYSQPTQRFRKMRADDTQMYMLQSYAVSAHRQQKVSASSAFIFRQLYTT